ncbi:hypothetical protein WJ23_35200 [Burkholderia lata]|nr:hypothetical protein WJ23_35200 [Burkholderia lata]
MRKRAKTLHVRIFMLANSGVRCRCANAPVRARHAGPGARVVVASTHADSLPAAARSAQWLRTQRMSRDDAGRSAARRDGRRQLARLCDRRDAIEGALL